MIASSLPLIVAMESLFIRRNLCLTLAHLVEKKVAWIFKDCFDLICSHFESNQVFEKGRTSKTSPKSRYLQWCLFDNLRDFEWRNRRSVLRVGSHGKPNWRHHRSNSFEASHRDIGVRFMWWMASATSTVDATVIRLPSACSRKGARTAKTSGSGSTTAIELPASPSKNAIMLAASPGLRSHSGSTITNSAQVWIDSHRQFTVATCDDALIV